MSSREEDYFIFRDIKQLLNFTLAYLEFVVYFEGVDFVEYFVDCPGDDPLLRVGCWSDGGSGRAHRVRLAGPGLSIGKHCHVITWAEEISNRLHSFANASNFQSYF